VRPVFGIVQAGRARLLENALRTRQLAERAQADLDAKAAERDKHS
jgi:hypothetical protein